jgi:hypothetical protein
METGKDHREETLRMIWYGDEEPADVAPPKTPEEAARASGAKRDMLKPYYHKIPRVALERLARRYLDGAERYETPEQWRIFGRTENWKLGDAHFFTDAFNHVIDHLYRWLEEGSEEDDHLAAAAWGIFALMWAEDRGKLVSAYDPTPFFQSLKEGLRQAEEAIDQEVAAREAEAAAAQQAEPERSEGSEGSEGSVWDWFNSLFSRDSSRGGGTEPSERA